MAKLEATYEFGDVRVDAASELVSRSSTPVLLEPKAFELLVYFLQHRGRLLDKQEILDAVWGETFVSENALTRVVAQLRKALGDEAHESKYIETVPRRGYRFIAPVRSEPRTETTPGSRWWAIPAGLAGLAVLAAALTRGPIDFQGDASRPQARPLTSLEGYEDRPAFSPDGRQIAYAWFGHIYVQLVAGGEPLQLTDAYSLDASPAWSPDGSQIAFVRALWELPESGRRSLEILAVSALGGSPRVLGEAAQFYSRPAWHPDGEHLVIANTSATEGGLELLSLRTGEARPFTFPPEDASSKDFDPAFSSDGERMAFIRGPVSSMGAGELYVMPSAGGEPKRVTIGDRHIRGFDWASDGTALVFAAPRPTGFETVLWKVPITGGEPVPIAGTEGALNPTVARDQLAYSREVRDLNVWRVGGPNAPEPGAPEKLIASTRDDFMAEYSPDGDEIALVSDRDGELAIWITDTDGNGARKLVSGTTPFAAPRWSPAGDEIAYGGQDSENHDDVFTVNVRGGPPRNVTASEFTDAIPNWSPDGRWMYFQSLRTGTWEIWRVPREGGEAIQISQGGGQVPYPLPNQVYYWNWDNWQVRSTGPDGPGSPDSEDVKVVVDHHFINWTVWNGKIVYVAHRGPEASLELFDPETEETRPIASLGEVLTWFGVSVSPDGRWIIYTQNDHPGTDILLVENFR